MQKISLILTSLAITLGLALTPLISTTVSASPNSNCEISGGISGGVECAGKDQKVKSLFGSEGIFSTVVNVLLFIIGSVSVIMIIYGGIRYVISGGDAKGVEAAKNTILYAIVGLIVSILAFAIVKFVTGSFQGDN